MNDILIALRERAFADEAFRLALVATRREKEPLIALCDFAQAHGFPLTLADVIADGEEFCCNQMKSTNGGNPMPYDCFGFDDAYEMFMVSLER